MKNKVFTIFRNSVFIPCMLFTCFCLLICFAKMIESNFMSISSAPILISITLIGTIFCGTYMVVSKTGNVKYAIILAVVSFVFLFSSVLIFCGSNSIAYLHVRNLISLTCGTILGIFFGKRKHYKLRNARKKRRSTTK